MNDPTSNLPAVRRDIERAGGTLASDDQAALEQAVRALEHQGVAMRIANAIGRQVGTLTKLLPMGVSTVVEAAANRAISAAMSVALRSLRETSSPKNGLLQRVLAGRDSRVLHKAAAAVSGAAGGAFGFASLPVELPVSTVIILRSIADIARRQGENLSDPEVVMACLAVFALGAHEKEDHYAESGYFAVRAALAKTVSEASKYVVSHGLSEEAAPVLVRLVAQLGSRFGLVVSEKLAAQAMPVVGAAGGAVVNYAFAEHFQSLAHGHFTVRRLERRYGGDVVRAEYDRLLNVEKVAA